MQLFARVIPFFLLAFLAGVLLASFGFAAMRSSWAALFLAALCLAVCVFRPSSRTIIAACCFLGLALGIFRFTLWQTAPIDPHLDNAAAAQVTLVGVVDDEPDVREGKTQLTIRLRSLGEASSSQQVSGKLLATAARYPEFHYGDVVMLRDKLERPSAFAGRDGRVFDYPSYLAAKGIHWQMRFPEIVRIGSGEGNPIATALFFVKHRFTDALALALPEPESALMGGLLLGGKQSLGGEWIERFKTAGIIHIVVLSGYNMTIVAEWIAAAFRFLGFFWSIGAGAVGIALFAAMTGGGATVVRAAIMALIALLARATGRTFDMGRALLLAATLMVAQNPSILVFDPSFQLSFLASLGLILVAPVIEHRIGWWRQHPALREALVATLATQLMVLPLLLFQTGMLSLVALPANLLILPLIPATMLFGFIAGLTTLVLPVLGFVVALPAEALLSWILGVARTAAAIPYAALSLSLSSVGVALCYLLLVYWLRREYWAIKNVSPSSVHLVQSHQARLSRSASDKTQT